jgi:hypothetical protein
MEQAESRIYFTLVSFLACPSTLKIQNIGSLPLDSQKIKIFIVTDLKFNLLFIFVLTKLTANLQSIN